MINFRYHVVSLTAVFLALAIGLVVGTAALNGPLTDDLNDRVNAIGDENKLLRDQLNHLEEETDKQEAFAKDAAPFILAGKLTGHRVLVVSTGSAGKHVADLVADLKTAGATVSGHVEISDKYTDPANNELLLDLANRSRPATVAGLPTNSNGVETSTALLAAVLLDRTPAVAEDARREVISAYSAGEFLIATDLTGVADSVVVVAAPPETDREAARKNAAVVTMVNWFDQAGPVVVAGSGVAGDGNVLSVVRGDPALTKTVSTVDNVATTLGKVVTVLALAEQLAGATGHYGIGTGAGQLMPKPSVEPVKSGA